MKTIILSDQERELLIKVLNVSIEAFKESAQMAEPIRKMSIEMIKQLTEIKMKTNKEYLGDGVYANFDGFNVVLTTENGIEATNTVFLEPEVIVAFTKYLEKLPEKIKQQIK